MIVEYLSGRHEAFEGSSGYVLWNTWSNARINVVLRIILL